LTNVIMRCLHKDPLQRPHSASAIVKVIDALQTGTASDGTANCETRTTETANRESLGARRLHNRSPDVGSQSGDGLAARETVTTYVVPLLLVVGVVAAALWRAFLR
jgi:hypothetical protein